MSKVTPPAPAGPERLTVKSNEVVPVLPSFSDTSLMLRRNSGVEPPQSCTTDAALRGVEGLAVSKSAEFWSVSWQLDVRRILLAFAAGAGVTVPSTNALVAVPYPTESTIVPVLAAPLRTANPPPAPARAPVPPCEKVLFGRTDPSYPAGAVVPA